MPRVRCLTGVFYVDTQKPDFSTLLNTVDAPLATLAAERGAAGAQCAERANAGVQLERAEMDDGDGLASLPARIERWLPEMYLVLGLVVTVLLCFLTAPFFGPDEPDQASRAISLSHGQLLAPLGPSQGGDEAGGFIDAGAVRAMDGMDDIRMAWEAGAPDFLDRPYGPVAEADQRPSNPIRWAGRREFLPFGNTAGYPPVLYLPAIAGWRAGEAAGGDHL